MTGTLTGIEWTTVRVKSPVNIQLIKYTRKREVKKSISK
jgi:hypothetical protein